MRVSHCGGFSCCGARALERRPGSFGARAQLLRGVWDCLGPGVEPLSSALAGRFLAFGPPGKSRAAGFCSGQLSFGQGQLGPAGIMNALFTAIPQIRDSSLIRD